MIRHEINFEEAIGKTVGVRTHVSNPVQYGLDLQSAVSKTALGYVPKGVFKFLSHEEADQWMMKHLLNPRGN